MTSEPALGQMLRASRVLHGIDQRVVAAELGVSRATVSDWETGRTVPQRGMLMAWCMVTTADFGEMEAARVVALEHRGRGRDG